MSFFTFVQITNCKARDLIRLEIGGVGHWAIVGEKGNAFFLPIIILSGRNAPYLVNVMGEFGISYEKIVLNYGQKYSFAVDHSGPCEIDEGALFQTKGSFITTENGSFLCADFADQSKISYFNIDTGEATGERGGARAAFQKWKLSHLSLGNEPVTLVDSSDYLSETPELQMG